jgi:hypothetical protein
MEALSSPARLSHYGGALRMIVRVGDTQVDVRVEAILSAPRFGAMSNFFAWVIS